MTLDLIDRLMAREGGDKITRDPEDPGGTTKYGISQRAYPNLDIEGLSYDRARMLYINDYLLKTNIGQIKNELVKENVFDYAVHSGPAAAIKAVQKLTGQIQDGKLGPQTLKAIEDTPSQPLVSALGRERISYLIRQCQQAPRKLRYLNGWIMRILQLYT